MFEGRQTILSSIIPHRITHFIATGHRTHPERSILPRYVPIFPFVYISDRCRAIDEALWLVSCAHFSPYVVRTVFQVSYSLNIAFYFTTMFCMHRALRMNSLLYILLSQSITHSHLWLLSAHLTSAHRSLQVYSCVNLLCHQQSAETGRLMEITWTILIADNGITVSIWNELVDESTRVAFASPSHTDMVYPSLT